MQAISRILCFKPNFNCKFDVFTIIYLVKKGISKYI